LELGNIVFPVDRSAQGEEEDRGEAKPQGGGTGRKKDQSSSGMRRRNGGDGEDSQRKGSPGDEEENLYLKMERRLTM
jgi:hypothetical protein